jgi:tetratricopeptide (TPR) repeat protein
MSIGKIEESAVLNRYSRMMQKAPLHQRLSAIKNAANEKIQRCIGGEAPHELAKMFMPKYTEEINEDLNDFALGRIYYFKGDMDKALRHLEEAYNRGETRAGLYLGKIYLEHMNCPDTALSFFIKAATAPDMTDLFPIIGKIYLGKNEVLKAIEYLDKAFIEGHFDVYDDLGHLYDQIDQPQKAAEIFENAFKNGEDNALGYLLEIYRNSGDYEERYNFFISELSDKDRTRLYFLEGYYTYGSGKLTNDPECAQNGLQKMIDVVLDGNDDSWETLFDSLLYEGLTDDAIALCQMLNKKKKKTYSTLAQLYIKLNDFDSAEKVCKDGVKAGDASCTYILGSLKEAKAQNKEAIRLYEKSAQNNDYRAYMNLALIYEREGNVSKAKENYEYAYMTPTKKLIAYKYLNFLLRNGFIDDAAKVFVAVVEMNVSEKEIYKILFNSADSVIEKLCNAALKAGHAQAHLWLAQFCILNNFISGAETNYRLAAEAGIKEAYVMLAKCLYGQGRFREAKREFVNAFKNKINCYREFAEVLESEGYYDQAILNYRMAIDMGDTQVYENLIMLLIRCEKFKEAQITMDIAMKKNLPLGYLFKHFENSPGIGINSDQRDIPQNELN